MAEIINVAGHAVTLLAADGSSLFLVKGFRGRVDDKFLENLDPNKVVLQSMLGNLPSEQNSTQVDYGHHHLATQIHNLEQVIVSRVLSLLVAGSNNVTLDYDALQGQLAIAADTGVEAVLSDDPPLNLGSPLAGSALEASRADHVHKLPTLADLGAAPLSHTHTVSNVTGLQNALDGKAPSSHGHTIANVTGLQDALDSKAADSHNHAIANITGLQDSLDDKASSTHNHVAANITDLSDTIATRVSTMVKAADSSITVQYSGISREITIKANPATAPVLVEAVVGGISWEPSATNGYAMSPDITMTGANLGDFVEVAPPYDVQGLHCFAYMRAVNVARIVVSNLSGNAITLPSGLWRTRVIMSGPASRTGSTANRPTGVVTGFQYFDTTLNKPIWYSGTAWVDAVGTVV